MLTGSIGMLPSASLDERARKAGVMLLPGIGFDVVPSDCLAAHVAAYKAQFDRVRLDLGAGVGEDRPVNERIRDFRAKELSQMTSLSGEQKAVELSELEKLKAKAAEIRAQHENWKRAHSAQISDPTRDPHYQELVQE